MSASAASRHHRIDYIEFTVTDMAESQTFYTTVFGWAFNSYAPEYAGIQGADGEVGGFAVGTAVVGGPLVVLYSQDIEATQDAVTEAGGTIIKPIFAFPGGRRFEFTDPSGNRLSVWSEPAES